MEHARVDRSALPHHRYLHPQTIYDGLLRQRTATRHLENSAHIVGPLHWTTLRSAQLISAFCDTFTHHYFPTRTPHQTSPHLTISTLTFWLRRALCSSKPLLSAFRLPSPVSNDHLTLSRLSPQGISTPATATVAARLGTPRPSKAPTQHTYDACARIF